MTNPATGQVSRHVAFADAGGLDVLQAADAFDPAFLRQDDVCVLADDIGRGVELGDFLAADAYQPLPTLEDVRSLTPQSDFQPFMQRGVGSEVRNAAMKKLFADPHFNVMDGLDIYIDDYSKPDPLPQGMLERMVQSDMLNLFRKKSEMVAAKEDDKSTDSLSKPENQALEVETQTDLTSSDIQGVNQSMNESSTVATNVGIPSSELEQKKT